jgi:hypothetical protein
MMKIPTMRSGVTLLAVLLCAASTPGTGPSFGPDSVVDASPTVTYVEPAIAVSPKDPRKLVAGSMMFAAAGITIESFRSDDGGYSWKGTLLPVGSGSLLGDVQADYDAYGTAYMTGLGDDVTPAGVEKHGLYVFASSDDGDTFRRLAFVQTPSGHSYDHEQLAIDRTDGKYRGRIYMSLLYTLQMPPNQVNGLGLIRSSDGGHTFSAPAQVSSGWSFNSRPVVLANGDVLFPFFHTAQLGDTSAVVQIARSTDGGASFGTPLVLGTRVVFGEAETMRKLAAGDYAFDGDSVPQFAAGRRPSERADSVYGVWSDMRSGTSRLLFTRSSDDGRHWTTPQTILTSADPADAQYQPSIAVNAGGVVGISWYNGSLGRNAVSEMFAISTDGGASFSTPVAISSTSSPLQSAAGGRFSAESFGDATGTFISFLTPGSRYPSGGDYMDLAADTNGAFHPIWIDARDGTDQALTATVFPDAAPPAPAGLSVRDVTSKLTLEFGTGVWDDASRTLTVPLRLHNTSTEVLYPPFTITVRQTHNPYMKASQQEASIVNADNGQTGVGAQITFTAQTLGNLGRLVPGAITAGRELKVKMFDNAMAPFFVTSVSGYATQ